MTKKRLVAGAVLTAATVAVILQVLPSAAHVPPIALRELTPRSVFTDDVDLKVSVKEDGEHRRIVSNDKNPSRTVVAKITLQPNAEFPWHSHPGPVIVNVASGELTYQGSEHCRPRAYPAGTAFVDPGFGHVHNAWNSSRGETVLVATFFSAPPEGALLIPSEEHCGG